MGSTTIQQANRDKRAALEGFKVKRDGEGKLIPIEKETTYGTVLVVPMVYGDAEKWAIEMKEAENVSADQLAAQFRKHIVDPDMSKITGDDLRKDFKPLAIQELLQATINASGLENEVTATVNADGTAKVAVKN